jgi:hypothetical protein
VQAVHYEPQPLARGLILIEMRAQSDLIDLRVAFHQGLISMTPIHLRSDTQHKSGFDMDSPSKAPPGPDMRACGSLAPLIPASCARSHT